MAFEATTQELARLARLVSQLESQFAGRPAPARPKLVGWKEIAAHLRRAQSKVRRTEGLPLRRDGRTVWAWRDEIEAWEDAQAPRSHPRMRAA